jgi:NAD(P)-dependent dehydrogenase (short-subunit alcohol dehydrogenase family)
MGKLNGKVAVVTGGSSGIGLAIAQRFVDEGAYVFITGRRQAELDKAAAEIGRDVTTVQGDIANLDDLDRLWATVKTGKGGVDIIVANAAVAPQLTLANATVEHFDETFNVNARGTFFTVQKALPLLRDNGSIVLIASGAHLVGIPLFTAYSASKAAVRSFARSWSAELAPRNIRVNSISPGLIDTAMFQGQFPDDAAVDAARAQLAPMIPLGRLGRPDELANAALFLASDDSSFTVGIDLVADGGQTQL